MVRSITINTELTAMDTVVVDTTVNHNTFNIQMLVHCLGMSITYGLSVGATDITMNPNMKARNR